ncbi:GNAT family N-acetyltransferase [Noviherbaspirillum saxi]|uniref:GNAT family N-acetyltransferase n=1 Tax=Noviherbaspirillum saxi TaxID=2320863 RepID=UPI0013149840|nr:GNAT family N-acetyltransferase [Noviherbaspirillum saxi]
MDRLYGSLYSSLSHFRTCDNLDGVNTYVAREGSRVSAIFLYRVAGKSIQVINEGMRLSAEDVSRFCDALFARYGRNVNVSFHAVQIDGPVLPFTQQRFFCTEDFVATLPDSADAYLASLGSATRKNIKRHKNRLERAFPDLQYRLDAKEAAKEEDVRDVIALNRIRMAQKSQASFIDEDETQRILRIVRACGKVFSVRIDGRLAAGAIVLQIGDSVISKVNAHDARYDDYRLGMLCCYLAVCAAIESGAKRFHFGHGRYEYKTALLGKHEYYDHVAIYRSRLHMLLHARQATRIAYDGYRFEASRWLLDRIDTGDGQGWALLRQALAVWRSRKHRHGSRLTA